MKTFRLPEHDSAAVIVFEDTDDEAFLTLLTWIAYGTNAATFTKLAERHSTGVALPPLRPMYSVTLYGNLKELADAKARLHKT